MRALIFDGKALRLNVIHPEPKPADGEALIRLVKGAVARTDLELCKSLFEHHGVLGHQFVGRVESINGSASRELKDKRVVGSIITVCGTCDMCVAGLSSHCRRRTILGIQNRAGCLADCFTLPVSNLTPVPDSLDNDHAVFAYEVAASIQTTQQLTIAGKPYITVLGDGSLGLLMAQFLGRLNVSVRLLGHHAENLAICEKWKIKHRLIDDIVERSDQDIVVDCTGSPSGLTTAMKLVRPRGKIVLKSLYARDPHPAGQPALNLSPVVLNEIEMIGSFGGPLREALAVLARGEIDVVSLISRRMSLNDGPALFATAAQPGIIKVLVDP